ncbi:putative sagittal suture morphogenesis [Trypoxylus dichotomus]
MLLYAKEEISLRWVYMNNNNPKHASRRVKDLLRRASVKLLVWLPIKHLWIDVKQAVFAAAPTSDKKYAKRLKEHGAPFQMYDVNHWLIPCHKDAK